MKKGTLTVSALSIAGAYLFMLVLILWPVLDLTSSVWPPQPGNIQWRYGFMGLMAAFLHTPILGILLAMGLAYALEHTITLRLFSVLSLLGALVLFLVLVLFPLDVIQLRSITAAERLPSFQAGAILAELKHLSSFVVLLLLGIGGWRTAKNLSKRAPSSKGSQLTAEVLKAQKQG